MDYRNGNYTAFYVDEPFSESNLGAHATRDFVYYQTLKMWKAEDDTFPFIDSHDKTYNVRDGSSWEATLRPRLHERLRKSKNIVLFLSSYTKASKALMEEMSYGISQCGLPVIVVYPDVNPINPNGYITGVASSLWTQLPAFKRNMDMVPTVHIPMKKELVRAALESRTYMVPTKGEPGLYKL